jgi:hypothetical protein
MEGHVLEQAELVGRYTTRAFRVIRVVLVLIGALVAAMAFDSSCSAGAQPANETDD